MQECSQRFAWQPDYSKGVGQGQLLLTTQTVRVASHDSIIISKNFQLSKQDKCQICEMNFFRSLGAPSLPKLGTVVQHLSSPHPPRSPMFLGIRPRVCLCNNKIYEYFCLNFVHSLHLLHLQAKRTLLMRHEAEIKSNAYWLGLLAHLQASSVPRKVKWEHLLEKK